MIDERGRAVVLLSGGLDSATALAIADNQGYDIYALSFNYQQRHKIELKYAEKFAAEMNVIQHTIVDIDLTDQNGFGGSALTQGDIDVPSEREVSEMSDGIPVTYVPARNTIFLAFALAMAEVKSADAIFMGVNALDYSGYPDCRPEFIEAYQGLIDIATKQTVEGTRHIRLKAPLINMTKAEIITRGLSLGVNYGLTSSCYNPREVGMPCYVCDSCILREKGFAEVGVADPPRFLLV